MFAIPSATAPETMDINSTTCLSLGFLCSPDFQMLLAHSPQDAGVAHQQAFFAVTTSYQFTCQPFP